MSDPRCQECGCPLVGPSEKECGICPQCIERLFEEGERWDDELGEGAIAIARSDGTIGGWRSA